MARLRKLKPDRPDLPPYRPLAAEEVDRIARAGGISFDGRADQAQKFEGSVDFLRCEYKTEAESKQLALPDKMIRIRLTQVLKSATQLHALLDDSALDYQMYCLNEGDDGVWKRLDLYPIVTTIHRAKIGLKRLDERSRKCPDESAVKPAKKPGLISLRAGLVHLWQVETGTTELQVGRKSHLARFVHKGAGIIAQDTADIESTIKWIRAFRPHALKSVDVGYRLFRPVTDPDVLRYLMENGVDKFKRAFGVT